MKSSLKNMVIALFVITAVSALLVALVNDVTKGAIELSQQQTKDAAKYKSEYVFIKNDKLAWLAGLILLVVTAVATVLGIAPQDVKQFSSTWWYELVINIVLLWINQRLKGCCD